MGGHYTGAWWLRRAGREGLGSLYEEKDLSHSKRVFNLFRREQVWTLSLSRVTGFLRARGQLWAEMASRVSQAWVGGSFVPRLSQERSCLCRQLEEAAVRGGPSTENVPPPPPAPVLCSSNGCLSWPTGERPGPQHLHSGSLSVHEGAECR